MMAERAPTALGQGGQALPVVLALAALAGLALVALYNVGQTASARVRLTHAADAAAYSGALEQARTLNLLAYINRAQVAHQIAMAHIVTLASWARFGQAQSTRRTQGNPPASLISMLFGSAAGAAYARSSSTGDAVPGLARAFQQHDHVVHQVLQRAAVAATDSLAKARLQSMLRVLHANYPEHYADPAGHATAQTGPVHLALLHDNSAGYVEQRRGNGDTGLRGMIELSAGRHDFLRPRDLTRHSSWIVQRTCPTRRHELRRRGGTWLDDEGRWGSLDTLSYHALRSNRWIGCYYREYAMGWGQAGASTVKAGDYVDKPPQDFSQQDFWRWVHENTSWNLFAGRSNPLANSYAVAGAARWPGKGLPSYHDVDPGAARQPLRFAIQVRQSASALATTDAASKVAAPAGRYAAATGLAGEEAVTVTSAAETYFARPEPRADGRSEYANLFRPYWQARLSAPVAPETGEVAP